MKLALVFITMNLGPSLCSPAVVVVIVVVVQLQLLQYF